MEQGNRALQDIVAVAQLGDSVSLTWLCVQFQPLLKKMSRRYGWLEQDDAYQIARLAFIEAVFQFNPSLGVPFEGFVQRRVWGALRTVSRRVMTYQQRHATTTTGVAGDGDVSPDWLQSAFPCERAAHSFEETEWRDWFRSSGLSAREVLAAEGMAYGYSVSDLAAIYGVGVESAKTWRRRALVKLRRELLSGESWFS